MNFSGTYQIPRSILEVWTALNDAQVLAACISGCRSLEHMDASKMVATVDAQVDSENTAFEVNIELIDIDSPNRVRLRGEAKSSAGEVAGEVKLGLVNADTEQSNLAAEMTQLSYEASVSVSGQLAQMESLAIERAAKKILDDFFISFERQVSPPRQSDQFSTNSAPPEKIQRADDGMLFVWGTAFVVLVVAMALAI